MSIANAIIKFDKLDFGQLNRVRKSFWLRSLWLHEESVESHQRQVIDQYCELINGREDSFYTEVRDHFLTPILEDVRAELGLVCSPRKPMPRTDAWQLTND